MRGETRFGRFSLSGEWRGEEEWLKTLGCGSGPGAPHRIGYLCHLTEPARVWVAMVAFRELGLLLLDGLALVARDAELVEGGQVRRRPTEVLWLLEGHRRLHVLPVAVQARLHVERALGLAGAVPMKSRDGCRARNSSAECGALYVCNPRPP
jgi:hypothetical protein